jgi:RNA polymerase sigma-70 factor (ECF subfamily)
VMSRLHRGRRQLREMLADVARERGFLRHGATDAEDAQRVPAGAGDSDNEVAQS